MVEAHRGGSINHAAQNQLTISSGNGTNLGVICDGDLASANHPALGKDFFGNGFVGGLLHHYQFSGVFAYEVEHDDGVVGPVAIGIKF